MASGAHAAGPGRPVRRQLLTARLLLRPVEVVDARTVLAGRAPAGLVLADGYPSRYSLDLIRVAARAGEPDPAAASRAERAADLGPFFVVRRSDHAVVGEIGCRVDGVAGTAHVGYTIVEPCWGLGYATEALRSLLSHLIDDVGVPRVVGETEAAHRASRRVMEKAGMRPCGPSEVAAAFAVDGGGERVRYEAVGGVWSWRSFDLAGNAERTGPG